MYQPGQIVPVSGIYGCGEDADGHRYESTDVKGNRFPPMPAGCRGGGWVLDKVRKPPAPPTLNGSHHDPWCNIETMTATGASDA